MLRTFQMPLVQTSILIISNQPTTMRSWYVSLFLANTYRNFFVMQVFFLATVYKFKRIVGKPNFSDQFKKIVKRYIRVGYNLDIMRQSACLVLNPITVYSYGFLFNCTTVGQASDSMTALT